jgi:hypothetical protein
MASTNDTSITPTSSLNYDDGQCAICLEPHVNKSHLNCGHVFCFDCLVEWSKVKKQCPTCKRPFTSFLYGIGSTDGQQIYTPEPTLTAEFLSQLNNPLHEIAFDDLEVNGIVDYPWAYLLDGIGIGCLMGIYWIYRQTYVE